MNKNFPTIEYVNSLTPTGMKEGRDNVLALMNILGNPQDSLKVFHVTGSNGKGSVCQMISQVLWKTFRKKVGMFTSPHFIKLNERFQINGTEISDEKLEKYYQKVLELSKVHNIPLSFFEIQVVVMVLYFTDVKVDYAVVEVGLGGTYDGTNIFKNPLACFITSITLEHTHVLGKKKGSVLKNKLGIVKPGTRLYTWIKNTQIKEYCRKNKVRNRCSDLVIGLSRLSGSPLTNLPGPHQQRNALLVLQALIDEGFDEKRILEGLKDISNPGRFEWISPTILVDTANNEESVKILAKMVSKLKKKNPTFRHPRANESIAKQGGVRHGDPGKLTIAKRNLKIIGDRFHLASAITEEADLAGMTETGLTVIFGTTQTDPLYAAKLANMIPANRKILIDDFCDRALPCSQYAQFVAHNEIIHLNSDSGIHRFIELSGLSNYPGGSFVVIYGSFYLIGEIKKLSIR